MPWERLPGSSEQNPEPVSSSLDHLVRRLGGPSSMSMAKLFTSWEEIVGPALAGVSQPVSMKDGTLGIEVADPAWVTQVRFLEKEVLDRVAGQLPDVTLDRLDVRVARRGR